MRLDLHRRPHAASRSTPRSANAAPSKPFDLPAGESQDLRLAAHGARRPRADHLQGGRGQRPATPTARKACCPCCRGACWCTESLPLPIREPATKTFDFTKLRALGRSRHASSNQSLTVQMVSQPAWYAVMALPYLMEYPYECTRADLQPALRQRAGPAHRRQRPEDPPRLRPVEGHRRPRQPAGEEPGPEERCCSKRRRGCGRPRRKARPAERRHPLRRQPPQRRDGAAAAASWPQMQHADGAWPWFPGGPRQRLHHAVHHHRLRPPAAPGREDRHGPGRQVARPARRLDRPHLPRDPAARQARTRTTSRRRSRCTSTAAASSSQDKAVADAAQGGGRLLARPGEEVLAASWPTASRRRTWPSA